MNMIALLIILFHKLSGSFSTRPIWAFHPAKHKNNIKLQQKA